MKCSNVNCNKMKLFIGFGSTNPSLTSIENNSGPLLSWISGFSIYVTWPSFQPSSPNTTTWAYLDSIVNYATSINKKIMIGFGIGDTGLPSWLTSAPISMPTYTYSGLGYSTYIPWNPIFQQYWWPLCQAFVERYSPNPTVAGMSVDMVPNDDEMNMPANFGVFPSATNLWINNYGYTDAVLLQSLETFMSLLSASMAPGSQAWLVRAINETPDGIASFYKHGPGVVNQMIKNAQSLGNWAISYHGATPPSSYYPYEYNETRMRSLVRWAHFQLGMPIHFQTYTTMYNQSNPVQYAENLLGAVLKDGPLWIEINQNDVTTTSLQPTLEFYAAAAPYTQTVTSLNIP
jgi:hypothetical protein